MPADDDLNAYEIANLQNMFFQRAPDSFNNVPLVGGVRNSVLSTLESHHI
jgi:hypothetical protein